jgi:hypothetical protein
MKNFLSHILFKEPLIKEYSTITCTEINEQVHLKLGKNWINVSSIHYLVCLEPVVFGIWLEGGNLSLYDKEEKSFEMNFISGGSIKNLLAGVKLEFLDKINENEGVLLLLKLTRSVIHQISWLKAYILYFKYYRKPGFSFRKLKSFISAFSYPRKVRLISFTMDQYYNIFPMDLLGEISNSKYFVFGLAHTNHTLSKIIESKKIVVSEVPSRFKELIYLLGKHHGTNPPALNGLPFKVKETDKWNFPIPSWVKNYKEIKITKNINLGSHMLLWGEIENEITSDLEPNSLFHLHFVQYLFNKKRGSIYREV